MDIHAVTTRSTPPVTMRNSPSVHMRLRDEGEPGAALAEDLAHQRHGRPREETAAHGDVVAVLDARHGVLDGGELLSRRLGLALQPPAGGDEIALGGLQVRISQRAWWRSSSRRVRSSMGCSRSGTSTCLASPHSGVVK